MSRYDTCNSSYVEDIDGEKWPDPLSLVYNKDITEVPTTHKVTTADIAKFWLCYQRLGRNDDYDDILLSRNQIPYIGLLRPGDSLYVFGGADFLNVSYND
jgi:hypothetical protein